MFARNESNAAFYAPHHISYKVIGKTTCIQVASNKVLLSRGSNFVNSRSPIGDPFFFNPIIVVRKSWKSILSSRSSRSLSPLKICQLRQEH